MYRAEEKKSQFRSFELISKITSFVSVIFIFKEKKIGVSCPNDEKPYNGFTNTEIM